MKKNLIIMAAPVLLLLIMLLSGYDLAKPTPAKVTQLTTYETGETSLKTEDSKWVRMDKTSKAAGSVGTAKGADEIIDYALSLIGAPYQYAGITPSGFDCSGFVTHVFDEYGFDVPHSSALQAEEGISIAKEAAAPGDLVIFTGTDESVRQPGHVGIVISSPGDTISFVHSSSNGGVKISKVQGTRYNVRFLEVRRVL